MGGHLIISFPGQTVLLNEFNGQINSGNHSRSFQAMKCIIIESIFLVSRFPKFTNVFAFIVVLGFVMTKLLFYIIVLVRYDPSSPFGAVREITFSTAYAPRLKSSRWPLSDTFKAVNV